jgi:hypothetical protein
MSLRYIKIVGTYEERVLIGFIRLKIVNGEYGNGTSGSMRECFNYLTSYQLLKKDYTTGTYVGI